MWRGSVSPPQSLDKECSHPEKWRRVITHMTKHTWTHMNTAMMYMHTHTDEYTAWVMTLHMADGILINHQSVVFFPRGKLIVYHMRHQHASVCVLHTYKLQIYSPCLWKTTPHRGEGICVSLLPMELCWWMWGQPLEGFLKVNWSRVRVQNNSKSVILNEWTLER